jgi:hypothetical protein
MQAKNEIIFALNHSQSERAQQFPPIQRGDFGDGNKPLSLILRAVQNRGVRQSGVTKTKFCVSVTKAIWDSLNLNRES